MKLYIFLTHGIVDIGGGQLYVSSKTTFLERLGWDVTVFSFTMGEVIIETLKKYASNIYPELAVQPMLYLSRQRNNLINKIAKCTNNYDEIIIESNSITLSIWGELIAFKCNGKHFMYNLNETPRCDESLLPFFKFKYDRKELAFIKKDIVTDFFSSFFQVENTDGYSLAAAYSVQPVQDVDFCQPEQIEVNGRYTIGVIGRLAKPFIKKVSFEIKEFANTHPTVLFNILYIGGDSSGEHEEEKIKEIYNDVNNVKLYMLGYMFPIPRKIMRLFNICISSSGASYYSACEGVLTIVIDANDLMPIGILGVNTKNIIFRDCQDLPVSELKKWISDIMDKKYDSSMINISLPPDSETEAKIFKSHMEFVKESCRHKAYYTDFYSQNIIKKIVLNLIGIRLYSWLWRRFH